MKSGVPGPIYTDGGLTPAKPDDSKGLDTKRNRKPTLVSKTNCSYCQEMAADANADSADTSTLVKTVTGDKPDLDSKGTVAVQPEEKITGKVEDGNGCDPRLKPEKKSDDWGRLQFTLSSCIEINGKAATPPWLDFEHQVYQEVWI